MIIKICAYCKKQPIKLDEDNIKNGDAERDNLICDDCYMLLLEPDYWAGEYYSQ